MEGEGKERVCERVFHIITVGLFQVSGFCPQVLLLFLGEFCCRRRFFFDLL